MPIYGKHNASNALVAIAIGKFLGLDDEQIKKGLAEYGVGENVICPSNKIIKLLRSNKINV
jgi:UDP-N-acetylmuramyl pentapeptide synthase